jgi:hypothetical protein
VLKRGPTGSRKPVCISLGPHSFLPFWTQEPGSVEAVRTEGGRRVGTLSGGATQMETHVDSATGRRWQVTGGWAGGRDLTRTESPGGTERRGPRGGDHAYSREWTLAREAPSTLGKARLAEMGPVSRHAHARFPVCADGHGLSENRSCADSRGR